jgi:hypothetical protein
MQLSLYYYSTVIVWFAYSTIYYVGALKLSTLYDVPFSFLQFHNDDVQK